MKEKLLLDWVESFMQRFGLFASQGVVGLSGGADSLLLSYVLEQLKSRGHFLSLRHIHIDHGLRPNSSEQAFNLQEFAKEQAWDFEIIKVTGPVAKSNIEAWARDQRKDIFKNSLKAKEALYLGHHIDDSFEWFLRQTLASSSSGLTHGIPVRNGSIRRPLHCLTKKQISRFAKALKLPVQIDQSNDSLAFQRNAISKTVKKPLLEIFPKGLAHYVEHANSWANKEGLSCETKATKVSMVYQNYVGPGVYSLIKISAELGDLNNWRAHKEEIVSLISLLSLKGRGELRQNLEKLFAASQSNGVRGPLNFSGGVRVFLYPGMLLFVSHLSTEQEVIEQFNGKYIKAAQIPSPSFSMKQAEKEIELLGGIGLLVFEGEKLFGLKGLKEDALFQPLINELKTLGLSLRPFSQMYQRAMKANQMEKLFKGLVLH